MSKLLIAAALGGWFLLAFTRCSTPTVTIYPDDACTKAQSGEWVCTI